MRTRCSFPKGSLSVGSTRAHLGSPRTSDNDIPVDETAVPTEFLKRGILIEAAALESI